MKRIAIIVGHTPSSPGAYSQRLSTSEYFYNKEVADYLRDVADIYYRPQEGGYSRQMLTLASHVDQKNYDFAIELHFNAANRRAQGCEALVWEGNKKSTELGNKFCRTIADTYNIPNRGVKSPGKGGRGYEFLRLMRANAIILEPFFGDSDGAEKFENPALLASVIKNVLCRK